MAAKFILCVALVAAATVSVYGLELNEETKKTIGECAKDNKLDMETILKAVKNKEPPKTKEGKCFIDCIAKGVGLIKDSTFDADRAKELAASKLKDKPEILEKANEVIDACATIPKPDGECEYAVALMTCSIEKAKELGIPDPEGFAS